MSEPVKLLVGALIRNALAWFGGWLVAKGWLDKEQWGQVDLTPIVSGIVVVAGALAWSFYQKLRSWITFRTALRLQPHHTEEEALRLARDLPTTLQTIKSEEPKK